MVRPVLQDVLQAALGPVTLDGPQSLGAQREPAAHVSAIVAFRRSAQRIT